MENKNTGMKILIVILILLVIAMGGFIFYDKVLKEKYFSKNQNFKTEEKQTDKDEEPKKIIDNITNLNSYMNAINVNQSYNDIEIIIDSSFDRLDFMMDKYCIEDGKNVEFELNGNKIKYTCNYDEEFDSYDADVLVNNDFKYNISTFTTCGVKQIYTNKAYYIVFDTACTIGGSNLEIYKSNKLVKKIDYISSQTLLKDDYDNYKNSNPFIKNGKLYYITPANVNTDYLSKTTCNIKYIDLTNSDIDEFTTGSFECYYGTGE